MSYAVWIVVENEDTGEMRWWSIDHHHTAAEAIEHAEDMGAQEYARTGLEPQALDYDETTWPADYDEVQ